MQDVVAAPPTGMCPASISGNLAVLLVNLFNERWDLVPVVTYRDFSMELPGLACMYQSWGLQ